MYKRQEENIILLNKFDPEDYQSMKDYLSVMVINTDANKEALENLPHKETEDLSIISYINVPEDAGIGNGIIKVTKGLMNIWNISETELFAEAEKNSSLINPPALFNVKKMIFKNDQRNYLTAVSYTHLDMEKIRHHFKYKKSSFKKKRFYPSTENEKKINIYSIIKMCNYLVSQPRGQNRTALDEYFDSRPEDDFSRIMYGSVITASENTKGTIMSVFRGGVSIFGYDSIRCV